MGVLTLLALSSVSVRTAAQITLSGRVASNYRGTYDILVRPKGTSLPLERTKGLVEPNFLNFTGQGGITHQQLEQIRRVPGVGLAAPVSVIGYVTTDADAPIVYVDKAHIPSAAGLYEMKMSAFTTDGTRRILVQSEVLHTVLSKSAAGIKVKTDGKDSVVFGDGAELPFSPLPAINSPIIAVDPKAESQLLGDSPGFLSPLAQLKRPKSGWNTRDFPTDRVASDFEYIKNQLNALADAPASSGAGPVLPVVVNERLYSSLNISVQITKLGGAVSAADQAAGVQQALDHAGQARSSLGSSSADLTKALKPLEVPDITLAWPGGSSFPGSTFLAGPGLDFNRITTARPQYSIDPSSKGALTFSIKPLGAVGPDGTPSSGATDSQLQRGVEQSYRQLQVTSLHVASNAPDGVRPYSFAPISTFDMTKVKGNVNPLNYVPLGAYSAPDTQRMSDGKAVLPTLNPAGLLSIPPLVVGDIRDAPLLRGSQDIDAVRIRVDGVSAYNSAGIARVEHVASALRDLGLDVDIVAGSSPQEVHVYVPGYNVDSPNQLGYIRQGWTTLGAAQSVQSSLTFSTKLLLAMGLGTSTVCVLILQAQSVVRRRSELALLHHLGWGRLHAARFMSGDAFVGGILTALAVTAFHLRGGSSAGFLVGLCIAALPVSVAFLGSLLTSSSSGRRTGDLAPDRLLTLFRPVSRDSGLASRSLLARPIRSILLIFAIAFSAIFTGLAAGAVQKLASRAGPTRLGRAAAGDLRFYSAALLVSCALASLVALGALSKADINDTSNEFRVLMVTGWESSHIRRYWVTRLSYEGVTAIPIVVGLTLLLSARLDLGWVWVLSFAVGSLVLSMALFSWLNLHSYRAVLDSKAKPKL